jgi:hypothetical protein
MEYGPELDEILTLARPHVIDRRSGYEVPVEISHSLCVNPVMVIFCHVYIQPLTPKLSNKYSPYPNALLLHSMCLYASNAIFCKLVSPTHHHSFTAYYVMALPEHRHPPTEHAAVGPRNSAYSPPYRRPPVHSHGI